VGKERVALSETIIYYLIMFLAGYLIGKAIGLEQGLEKSAAAIPLELRERSLEQGCCLLCGTEFTSISNSGAEESANIPASTENHSE